MILIMEILDKLKILADSAKYDASCSSSGSKRKNIKNGRKDKTEISCSSSFKPSGQIKSGSAILLFLNSMISTIISASLLDNMK